MTGFDLPSIPRLPGVYVIRCRTSSQRYVGSSLDLFIRARTHWGLLNAKKHKNTALQEAFNRHGAGAFTLEVLEVCDPDITQAELFERERFHKADVRPNLNGIEPPRFTRAATSGAERICFSITVDARTMGRLEILADAKMQTIQETAAEMLAVLTRANDWVIEALSEKAVTNVG
jgi:hypothetical protein